MRITIDTDGSAEGTVIAFEGAEQADLVEFHFSVKAGGRCKLQLLRKDEKTGKLSPGSFYGGDFEKFSLQGTVAAEQLLGARKIQKRSEEK